MSRVSERAVDALAEFLIVRDRPEGGRIGPGTIHQYKCRAAAILNGEAWAIQATWPAAAAGQENSDELAAECKHGVTVPHAIGEWSGSRWLHCPGPAAAGTQGGDE